jgi:uncharacterized protein (DUF885 family)
MTRVRPVLLLSLLSAFTTLWGCAQHPSPAALSPSVAAARVTALADDYVADYFAAFPHQAALLGVTAGAHDRLPELSPVARTRWEAREDSLLATLEAIDASALGEGSAAAVTHGFLRELLRNSWS